MNRDWENKGMTSREAIYFFAGLASGTLVGGISGVLSILTWAYLHY